MTEGHRIVLSTFGSLGDLHPYIAIALELKARGHHPVIATSEAYREKTDALGLELRRVRPDLPGFDRPDELAAMVSKVMDARTGSQEVFETFVVPHLADIYEDLSAAVEGADLIVTHPLPLVGPIVAEKRRLAWVSSVLAPISLFSVYDPPVPPQMPGFHRLLKLSPLVGRAAMKIARLQLQSITEPVQRLRARVGLPRGGNPLFEGQHAPSLVLALFSRVLAAPQPDWPPQTRVTGFPFYDRRDRAGDTPGLARELTEFLDAGEPPIIFTLGSSAIWVAEDFYTESVKAARTLGRRAVLLIGDERNRPRGRLPEGVAAFDYAPFGELLPRGCATVHQGGVGTTGQALRAGRPSLVVPFSHDQFDNGERVRRLGAGRTLPRSSYNARTAARELQQLLGDPLYAERAAEVGRIVQSEDGTRTACDLIEGVLRR
ncbi:MAG TPA: nucleotide disphospho-sugar-binding domain-containing protein [Pyrinomonadaceae bacterium]|nr:nucleotide disphospho-sugar-binding domain-containing protein [Pyrinomonadaceae bacterium]